MLNRSRPYKVLGIGDADFWASAQPTKCQGLIKSQTIAALLYSIELWDPSKLFQRHMSPSYIAAFKATRSLRKVSRTSLLQTARVFHLIVKCALLSSYDMSRTDWNIGGFFIKISMGLSAIKNWICKLW